DLVRVDADRVLEPPFVLVDRMLELVVSVALESDGGGEIALADRALRDLVADRSARQDLERVEMEVDRVRIPGQVDQLPDLVLAEHREKRGRVLEVRGDRAVAGGLLTVADGDERSGVIVAGVSELPQGKHDGPVVDLSFDECNHAARG